MSIILIISSGVISFCHVGFFLLLLTIYPIAFYAAENDTYSSQEKVLIVSEIYFDGNRILTDRELNEQITTRKGYPYNQSTAIDDSEKIALYYQRRGYSYVKVNYPQAIPVSANEVDVTFTIVEMQPIIINEIIITGNSYLSNERIFRTIGINPAGEHSYDVVNRLLLSIVDLYASRGFLFTKVELDSLVSYINSDNGHIEDVLTESNNRLKTQAYLTIDEGRFARFDNFIFTGNEVTAEKTLLRLTGLDQEGIFTLSRLEQAEENVRRKEYISDFSLIPINHQTLLMRVEEDRMTHLYGMVGYDSSQQDKARRLTGFVNLKLLNLYGTDRSLVFLWRRMQAYRQSVEFRYYESGPFQFPVAGELTLYRETVDSTYILTTVESEVYYYNLRNKYGIYVGSDDIFPGTRRPKIIDKKSYKKGGLFWRYNSEDYYLNPTKGMNWKIRHYYILDRVNGSWKNKQASEISWSNYFPLTNPITGGFTRPMVLMLSINGNQIENKDLQEYELYTLGGLATIRGFRENRFSGYRTLWSNLELRYLLTRRSRVFLFADYGYVQTPQDDEPINDLLGVGFGIRLDTKIGLIGVDYGFSHSNGTWLHPIDGMVHFGIETRF